MITKANTSTSSPLVVYGLKDTKVVFLCKMALNFKEYPYSLKFKAILQRKTTFVSFSLIPFPNDVYITREETAPTKVNSLLKKLSPYEGKQKENGRVGFLESVLIVLKKETC